jgi:transcription antitermination factor NusG
VRRGNAAETEGGEALSAVGIETLRDGITRPVPAAPWHVVWTSSHCEQLVCDQLSARGFHPFLPRVATWSRRAGRRHQVQVPVFPGYVFLNDALDRAAHVEARKARGVVRVLGDGWERPAVVPPAEMDALRRLVDAGVPALPHPYLSEGRRVRITGGPLAGVEGVVLRTRPEKGMLVLSVHMLQRSVAAEVDWSYVEAA